MFKKLLFVLAFVPLTGLAQSIKVEYGFNIYSLDIRAKEITFKKKEFVSTVVKEECSTNLYNDFAEGFQVLTKEKPKDKSIGEGFQVKYTVDSRKGILPPSHPYAQLLLSIPQRFDGFKLATEYRCKKK